MSGADFGRSKVKPTLSNAGNVANSAMLSDEDDRQLSEASERFRPVGGKAAVRRQRLRTLTGRGR